MDRKCSTTSFDYCTSHFGLFFLMKFSVLFLKKEKKRNFQFFSYKKEKEKERKKEYVINVNVTVSYHI